MNAATLEERRKVTAARRYSPAGVESLVLSATGDGSIGPETGPRPSDLHLEITHENGDTVAWFDDNWWLATLRRWKDRPLTIHIQRTPQALLSDEAIMGLRMARRMQVPWRLVGHCYLSDLSSALLIHRLATSPYDEVRIIEADRPAMNGQAGRSSNVTLHEVFDRVRKIQEGEQAAYPILTRAPNPDAPRTNHRPNA